VVGFDPGICFLVGLFDVEQFYVAGLTEQVNAREDAEDAYHALESATTAHEQNEEELPQSARNRLEHFPLK
jgi:hypothetical protein